MCFLKIGTRQEEFFSHLLPLKYDLNVYRIFWLILNTTESVTGKLLICWQTANSFLDFTISSSTIQVFWKQDMIILVSSD